MSVNITVNGKFKKSCHSHPLLSDPQEVKKTEEKEKRKLRLLQVREECKKLAKKIRDEVNEEKRKELQRLQETKERELECWRQHALQNKGEQYREAIFQIGSAHRAAKAHNEENINKEKKQTSYKNFKKQFTARKCQPTNVKFNCPSLCPCQKAKPEANKLLKCTCTQTDEQGAKNNNAIHNHKQDFSFSSESECEEENCKQGNDSHASLISSTSTSDSNFSFSNDNQQPNPSTFVPTKNKCLVRTPAVLLDVEMGSDDSVTISAPAEVTNCQKKCNTQYTSVIRVSPRKGRQQIENKCRIGPNQESSAAVTSSGDSIVNKQTENKTSLEQHQTINNAQVSKEKRFTIISDLVKKHQENESRAAGNIHVVSHPPNAQTISENISPNISPKKQQKDVSNRPVRVAPVTQSPRKASATSKSSRTATTQALTSFTAASRSNAAGTSTASSFGRVQFYDYNSKLSKDQDQAATFVNVKRQNDQNQPSAMEQARLENQRERSRQMEALKKFQVMEERGQQALEREQVRRDCQQLTEKLDVLTREYANQFPINDKQQHIDADKRFLKESKMNSAIEKLLQRPNIITCSEQSKPIEIDTKDKPAPQTGNLINVASLNNKGLSAEDVSSDSSCCSILLGYVDDQSKLIKEDLKNHHETNNQYKKKRLENLLSRLDKLRKSLVGELRNESESKAEICENEISSQQENLKQIIDSISEMRKHHAETLCNKNVQDPKVLSEREKELQTRENLLDTKLKQFFEMHTLRNKPQKKCMTPDDDEPSSSNYKKQNLKIDCNEENAFYEKGKNPLEIIITVKGEAKSVKIPNKAKRKMSVKRSPNKLATLMRKSPHHSFSAVKKQTLNKKTKITKLTNVKSMLQNQNSYDSNSTSYMSLPPELPTKIDDLAEFVSKANFVQERKRTVESETVNQKNSNQKKPQEHDISREFVNAHRPVNPLIAQYVQRLLGMSRNAVQNLGVSSSDIETPSSSIIDTTDNSNKSDTIISDERLAALSCFIEENKSFIKDLEQSIRLQNTASFENSIKKFDDIWRKRLKKEKEKSIKIKKGQKITEKVQIEKCKANNKSEQKSSTESKEKDVSKHISGPQQATSSKPIEGKVSSTDSLLKDLSKSLSSHYSTDDRESISLRKSKRPTKTIDKAVDVKLSIDTSKSESDSQIARYAKLTENCTHRIAELTELINRVREEKQRLLEVTLSSVSDNGRQSTEYLELPEGKSSTRNEQNDLTPVSSTSEGTTQNKQFRSRDALPEMTKLSVAYKNKQITNSRDSGIADSRPVTALENRIDQEPLSVTSESNTAPSNRKMKPPPTLKRFSPQLPEDELAHELSTIFEVDTPATSRINTAIGAPAEEKENAFNNGLQQPVRFPTFEQYLKQLDLDITQLDPDQNTQLQQEFEAFLECLQQHRFSEGAPKYFEFPTINAYIQQLAEDDLQLGETMEESLSKLQIHGIDPLNFPALREYIQQNTSKSILNEEQMLLDTESLENLTEGQIPSSNTDNDTASLDIEEELKKRKILKQSFRVKKQQLFHSTKHKDGAFNTDILAAESGVDKLSTSGNTSDLLDSDVKVMVKEFKGQLSTKTKDVTAFSSSTTTTNTSILANSALRAAESSNESSKGSGHVFNLRDFLTRELEKLANNSDSTTNSTSDDSLRNHFLHSLIGSLTPRTAILTSKSGGQTLERQKTSTPVPMQSTQSTQTHSLVSTQSNPNNSKHLFSGESHLSSVHYQDRSE